MHSQLACAPPRTKPPTAGDSCAMCYVGSTPNRSGTSCVCCCDAGRRGLAGSGGRCKMSGTCRAWCKRLYNLHAMQGTALHTGTVAQKPSDKWKKKEREICKEKQVFVFYPLSVGFMPTVQLPLCLPLYLLFIISFLFFRHVCKSFSVSYVLNAFVLQLQLQLSYPSPLPSAKGY